jgi:hypothetical protein
MWNGPQSKAFVRRIFLNENGAVICPAFGLRHMTAGLDEFREASG